MKHSGRARKAALRIIFFSLLAVVGLWLIGLFVVVSAAILTAAGTPILLALFVLLTIFTLYFFRDPTASPPFGPGLVVSAAHGKVDAIDKVNEPKFMGGECQRVSVFLSVFDVHVQNAPVSGKVVFFQYTEGEFLNALKAESAVHNENVLYGFQASDPSGRKIAVRLIAGVLARRIVPFAQAGEEVMRGERISLIQFGSRADLYLPPDAKIKVQLGDRVKGGETVIAAFD